MTETVDNRKESAPDAKWANGDYCRSGGGYPDFGSLQNPNGHLIPPL